MADHKWKELIQKAGPVRLVLVVLCGIVLLLLSCGGLTVGSGTGSGKATGSTGQDVQSTDDDSTKESLSQYRERMENELVTILEQVQGVGKVQVMLTVQASNEKVTLKDSTTQENKQQEETVLVEDSDRNSSPYIIQEKEPELEGVVVVCDGGDRAEVKREITDAVGALFHIESHKIKVMKSKEGSE